ncbi:hypothetical protein GCM10027446_01970 [Angustibacter peucedani]
MADPAIDRLDNLLASLSLNLAADGQEALERASGVVGSAAVALLALDEFANGVHVGRLASVLGLTHSGAVRVVSQLEAEGLAGRRPGADRRRVEVRLTAKGRRRARTARRARDEVVVDVAAGLSAGQRRALEPLLDRLVGARVEQRLARRAQGDAPAWWCRACDFAACGRPDGRCPAQATAARETEKAGEVGP